jgi:hypothetical protein
MITTDLGQRFVESNYNCGEDNYLYFVLWFLVEFIAYVHINGDAKGILIHAT